MLERTDERIHEDSRHPLRYNQFCKKCSLGGEGLLINSYGDNQSAPLLEGGIVPLRFLGVGFYLAWLFTIHYSTGVFDTSSLATNSFIISNIANMIGLLTAALFARRIAPIVTKRSCLASAAITSCAGTLIATLAPLGGVGNSSMFFVGNALVGIGTALLILLWSELYSGLPRKEVGVFYSGSFVLAAVLFYLVSVLGPYARIATVAALPVLSVVLLVLSAKLLPDRSEEVKESVDSQWSFPWRPALLLAVYAFASTLSHLISFDENGAGMLGMLFIALVVLACNLFLFERFDVRVLYKITPPLIVAGFLLLSFFEGFDEAGNMLVNAGFSGFVILTSIVLSNISYTYGATAIWLFGVTRAFRVFASVVAALCYENLSPLGLNYVHALSALVIVLVVLCAMLFLSEKDFTTTWGIKPLSPKRNEAVDTYLDTLQGKCSIIARQYGLTQREEEVFVLLAQDESIAKVEETLFISNSTAKSHIRHIYAKLNVHSRQEIVDQVGNI